MGYLIYFMVMSFLNYLISLLSSGFVPYGSEIISLPIMFAFNSTVLLYSIKKDKN